MAAGRPSAILRGEVIALGAAVVALAVFRFAAAPKGFADQSSGSGSNRTTYGGSDGGSLAFTDPACTIHSATVGTVK